MEQPHSNIESSSWSVSEAVAALRRATDSIRQYYQTNGNLHAAKEEPSSLDSQQPDNSEDPA